MKRTPLLVGMLLLLGLLACADGTQTITADQLDEIDVGMTEQEVRNVLGPPKYRDTAGSLWTYTPAEGPYVKVDVSFDQYDKLSTYDFVER